MSDHMSDQVLLLLVFQKAFISMLVCCQVDTCHNLGLAERFSVDGTAIILFRDRQVGLVCAG